MYETKTIKQKARLFFIIFLPIFITQIGLSLMNFFDTTMSGQYSAQDLAGVAIAGSIWSPVYTGLNGILLAVTPIVSHLLGAKKNNEVAKSILQAIYVALVISLLMIIAGALFLSPILNLMDLEPAVRKIAFQYLCTMAFGIFPLLIYNVLRCFIEALGQTRITMFITLLALPINAGFNYLFIFGKFGFPALGGVGAGIATSITYWFVVFIAIYIVHKKSPFLEYNIFRKIYPVLFTKWKELLTLGLPIGLSIFFETSIFSAITMLMSKYDTYTIASYQAAVNFTSILYMVPLSVSMALTILVGFEIGAKRQKHAKQYSWLGIGLSVFISLFSATILYCFKYEIAGFYTNDSQVLQLTAAFLLYSLFFQVSDAIQASVQGALRGYKDVNITFVTTLIAYWVVGLPVGYSLANFTNLGPYGYWIGLIVGLSAGAIGLAARLIHIQKKYTILTSKQP
ncbi:MATE family efflux transporter [Caldibacillus lycopersici]|uniref:Probable multidrug resistance protein NorM n=1 Tax=Perspicuibacillus lycopersici TaxID=1325689 RepID=A0AAE3IUF0_9BACI|nr:MATE family efflux transporter [Perspicuibacillus lycopersici]MCU9613609.1 MATE family efflux transporter [Perspicuibacillus lycopersici]